MYMYKNIPYAYHVHGHVCDSYMSNYVKKGSHFVFCTSDLHSFTADRSNLSLGGKHGTVSVLVTQVYTMHMYSGASTINISQVSVHLYAGGN